MAAFCRMPRDSSRAAVSRLSVSSNCSSSDSAAAAEVGHAIGRRDEIEVLPNRQGIEQPRIVGHEGQLLLGGDRVFDDVVSADREPSGGRLEDSGHGAEGRGLPGPVGTEHAQDRPGSDVERQVLHRQGLAVVLREAGYGNHACQAFERMG